MAIDTSLKILLVEDSPVMRKMEKKVFTSLGIKSITEAENGKEAVNFLESNPDIQLIVSDWNMPQMDGYELLNWVRGDKRYAKIPFLMASGRGEKGEIAKASEAGVSGFIAKPFNGAELEEKIEIALGLRAEKSKTAESGSLIKTTEDGKLILKMAHIQITDHLVFGVLEHMIQRGELKPQHFELETQCMASWNPLAESLEEGTVCGAAVLAPIAMNLYGHDTPIKLIMLAHKNGSIFVRNKKGSDYREPYQNFFRTKSFFIPHMLSIHNILSHLFFSGIGLKYGAHGEGAIDVNFEIVPPVKMPELITEQANAAGYLVAEPLGTKAITAGNADLQFLSSELWDGHPCCVITMRDEIVEQFPEAVQEFSTMLVKAGRVIAEQPETAAEIAVNFLDPNKVLGLKVPVLYNVLTEPKGIRTDDLYPVIEDLDEMQKYMKEKMGIGKVVDLDKFVDLRFVEKAYKGIDRSIKSSSGMITDPAAIKKLLSGTMDDRSKRMKALLSKEGQYLFFSLAGQQYGVNILKIKEIITMQSIDTLPNTDPYVKGVMLFRGNTIPVIDLRLMLGMEAAEYNERSVIIILEMESKTTSPLIGLVVESVSEVSEVKSAMIDKPEAHGSFQIADYILGMVKNEKDQNVKALIDVEILLRSKDSIHGESLEQVA